MHVTMGVLNIPDDERDGKELEQVKCAIAAAMREFKDLLSRDVFYIGMSGVEVFTSPCQQQHVVS